MPKEDTRPLWRRALSRIRKSAPNIPVPNTLRKFLDNRKINQLFKPSLDPKLLSENIRQIILSEKDEKKQREFANALAEVVNTLKLKQEDIEDLSTANNFKDRVNALSKINRYIMNSNPNITLEQLKKIDIRKITNPMRFAGQIQQIDFKNNPHLLQGFLASPTQGGLIDVLSNRDYKWFLDRANRALLNKAMEQTQPMSFANFVLALHQKGILSSNNPLSEQTRQILENSPIFDPLDFHIAFDNLKEKDKIFYILEAPNPRKAQEIVKGFNTLPNLKDLIENKNLPKGADADIYKAIAQAENPMETAARLKVILNSEAINLKQISQQRLADIFEEIKPTVSIILPPEPVLAQSAKPITPLRKLSNEPADPTEYQNMPNLTKGEGPVPLIPKPKPKKR